MGLVYRLLTDPQFFRRFIVTFVFLSISLSMIQEFIEPVFYAMLLILFLLSYEFLKNTFQSFLHADPIYKLNLFLFTSAFFIFSGLIWVGFALQPNPILIGIIALVTYNIWQTKITTRLESFPYKPILRSEIDNWDISMDWSSTVIPLTLGSFLTIAIILLESFITSMTRDIFIFSSLRWLVFLGLVTVHALGHARVINEFVWKLDNGVTRFIPEKISTSLPSVHDPRALAHYFSIVGKIENPPPEVFGYIEDNLEDLVKHFRTLEYIQVLHSIVRAFSYWGKQSKSHLHLLHLCVLASFSRFRALGLVPLYNRFMFYSYIELVYRLGGLPEEWLAILRFELEQQRDDYHRLDWIFNLPYTDAHNQVKWITLHNGKIYKGPLGYELVKQLEIEPIGDYGHEQKWVDDTWEITFTYLQLFVGPHAANAFEGNFSLDEAIDFLARKQSLEDFQIHFDRRKEDLLNPSDRMVDTTKISGDVEQNEAEMTSYLEGGSYNEIYDNSMRHELSLVRSFMLNSIKSGSGFWLRLLLLVLLSIVNVYALYLLSPFISINLIQAIIVIEVAITQFMSITVHGGSGLLDQSTQVASAQDAVTPAQQYKSRQIDSKFNMFNGFSLIYSILLLLVYGLMRSFLEF